MIDVEDGVDVADGVDASPVDVRSLIPQSVAMTVSTAFFFFFFDLDLHSESLLM